MKTQVITLFLMFSMAQAGNASAASQAAENDARSRIAALEARVTELEETVSALQANLQAATSTISELKTTKADINHRHDNLYARLDHNHDSAYAPLNSNIMDLDPYLTVITAGGIPRAILKGINLQVLNGLGGTASANGLGNIIIGYDEGRGIGAGFECSLGFDSSTRQPVSNQSECETAGGIWDVNHKSGSHYLVVGPQHNYTRWGGIVVGFANTSNFGFASVSGGAGNTASGLNASVSGGGGNTASAQAASVSGGRNNTASNLGASVSGGESNHASGPQASVSGGRGNTARHFEASVSGGFMNTASGSQASVSGGSRNTASGSWASVSGGGNREATDTNDWVAGELFQDQ